MVIVLPLQSLGQCTICQGPVELVPLGDPVTDDRTFRSGVVCTCFLSNKVPQKALGGRHFATDPIGSLQRSPDPLAGGGGTAAPHKNPNPALGPVRGPRVRPFGAKRPRYFLRQIEH